MESQSEDVEEDMGEMYLNEIHSVTFDRFGIGKVARLDTESSGQQESGQNASFCLLLPGLDFSFCSLFPPIPTTDRCW